MRKLAGLSILIVALLGALPALVFVYAHYEDTDLDALLAQKRPKAGFDLQPTPALKLKVTLVSYAEPCETVLLKRAMAMTGFSFEDNAEPNISRCVKVSSAKGAQLRVFIQDLVSEYMPNEVPLGTQLTLFAVHLFTTPEGPGLLVNEFTNEPTKKAEANAANGTDGK
jgi:hypothetical protein